ncbi:MAG: hypothetical protein ACI4T2_01155 [Christensenellales bacterium]
MLTLKFCGIRVYFAKLKMRGKSILISTKRKRSDKEIEISTEKINFAKNFFEELVDVLSLRKLCVYLNVGVQNPFITAMIGGAMSSITNIVALKLKMKKPHSDIVLLNHSNFEKTCVVFSTRIRFFITLSDVGLSFLRAAKKTKKEEIKQWKQNYNKAK